jgi:tetratricopeptide (TPR) repeat protein
VVGEVPARGKPPGQRRHAFVVRGAAAGPAAATASLASLVGDLSPLAPRFTRDAVLTPAVLADAYAALERQVTSEAGKAALARARTGDRAVAASLAGAEPVAGAFFRGLADLEGANLAAADAPSRAVARADLERAAQGFRDALRADPDFLPAAIYLGACYALGGRDQEAAGAWQTALIALDSTADVFRLTVDARLRAGDWSGADELLAEAEQKFPGDGSLTERRVIVELAVGRVDHGLALLDRLDPPPPDLLFAAMRILHGAHTAGIAVEDPTRDRERFARYLTAYVSRKGPDRALAERWFEAMK